MEAGWKRIGQLSEKGKALEKYCVSYVLGGGVQSVRPSEKLLSVLWRYVMISNIKSLMSIKIHLSNVGPMIIEVEDDERHLNKLSVMIMIDEK